MRKVGLIHRGRGGGLAAALLAGAVLGQAFWPTAMAASAPPSRIHWPLTIQDDIGDRVTLSHPARRIVVIEPSNAEIALDLGLKPELVGADASVFRYAPAPWKSELAGIPNIGASYPAVSEEAIVARRPDLVIAPAGVAGLTGLSQLGIPVLTLEPSSIAGIYRDIRLVGEATAHTRRAAQLIRRLKAETSEIAGEVRREATHHPRVFLDLGGLYTAGPHSFIANLIDLAGGINVGNRMSTRAYPKVTAEQVVRADPSVIIVDPEGTSVAAEEKIAGFSSIRAVKTHHVFAMPRPSYVDQPSPGFVRGIVELARLFYPRLHFTAAGKDGARVEP